MKLENQVAIVTGAGRNIGEQIAYLLAGEGAHIAVVDLDEERANNVGGPPPPPRPMSPTCPIRTMCRRW